MSQRMAHEDQQIRKAYHRDDVIAISHSNLESRLP